MHKKILSGLALLTTFIGSLGVGIELILSETLYPDIDTFGACPTVYKNFMYISLIVVLIGIILSACFRRRSTTKKIEIIIEILLIVLGFIGLSSALSRKESKVLDFTITFGGLFACVGFFTGISSLIGIAIVDKNLK